MKTTLSKVIFLTKGYSKYKKKFMADQIILVYFYFNNSSWINKAKGKLLFSLRNEL